MKGVLIFQVNKVGRCKHCIYTKLVHEKRQDGETGMILGLHPDNERRCYKVTPSLIGWAQTLNQS